METLLLLQIFVSLKLFLNKILKRNYASQTQQKDVFNNRVFEKAIILQK